MSAVKYILMGMGFMALLVIGSCSLLTYSAVKVAQTAAVSGGDAIDRLEEAADKQAVRAENQRFYRESGREEFERDYDSGYE